MITAGRSFTLALCLLVALSACASEPQIGHLTAVQQNILATPPDPAPDLKFSFDNPAGPQFTPKQQQAQLQAGKTIVPMVTDAHRRGLDLVRIPPGNYRFGKETWDRNGVAFPLEFSDLQRDAEHPFTIDARGVTFWFDLGEDQAPKARFCVGFRNCSNIIFQGATIDRGTRGNIEGRITRIDLDGNRFEIQLSPGATVPATFNDRTEQRLLPFKSDGRFCAPLYALQSGGVHLKYKAITPSSAAGRVYVTMSDTALLDRLRDPDWIKAYGELGTLAVGDGLSCVYSTAQAISLSGCCNMTMLNLRIHIAKGGCSESGGYGGHLWKGCYFGPRPGTSQWQGGDGLMLNATRHGATLDHVTLVHSTDDPINIHGYWGRIKNATGSRVSFDTSDHYRRKGLSEASPGDRLNFYDPDTGRLLGSAIARSIDGDTATLDQPADAFAGSIVEWPDHQCAGWTIQNCNWQDNYQRLLIQSGPGIVRSCTFTRQGSAIELNSVMGYVEGGVPRNITLENNIFTDVNPQPHGATITVYAQAVRRGESSSLENLIISGNTFNRPGEAAIRLRNVKGGIISNNRIIDPFRYTELSPRRAQVIQLERCQKIVVQQNNHR